MANNDGTRQALGREYYSLLDKMCDCHAVLTFIIRNASYSESIKAVTDLRIRDLQELLETTSRGLKEVHARQMMSKVTVEP